jgi:hypothetical protein
MSPEERGGKSAALAAALIVAALAASVAALLRVIRGFIGPSQPASSRARGTASEAAAPPDQAGPQPGSAPGSPSSLGRSLRFPAVLLVIAIGFAMLAFGIYDGLRDWRPPVSVNFTANNAGGLQDLDLTSASGSAPMVRWQLTTGYVRKLTVSAGQEMAEVQLPLQSSACGLIAGPLGARCTDGRMYVTPPVEFSWSSPQSVSSAGGKAGSANSLDVTSSPAQAGAQQMTLSTQDGGRPGLCFTATPGTAATLTLYHGSGHARRPLAPGQAAITCGAGLVVLVGLPGSQLAPVFELDGISALNLTAAAPSGVLQGFAGQISLDQGAPTTVASATVSLHAGTRRPIVMSLDVGPDQFSAQSGAATNVLVNADELVPSQWVRNSGIILPLFGAYITAFVVAPLGAVVQALMGELKRSQDRFRWLARRDRKERRHAG